MSTDFKAGNIFSVAAFIFGLHFTESHLCEFSSTGFAEGKKTK